jgi:hypothetical protein
LVWILSPIYGPAGPWVALFGRSPQYLETLLLRDKATPMRYVTIDRWRDEPAYRECRAMFAHEYHALDASCEDLAQRETSLGSYSE